jgi:dTMP kinase
VTAPGFFIVLEGGEGSGKSTVATALASAAERLGREVVRTREPGGTPVAEAIRGLLLSADLPEADPWCEALLFAAARADHVGALIRPALDRGAVVVCDRFVDSSAAYQGLGRGVGAAAVLEANAVAIAGAQPDLTLLLDIDPMVGLQRAVAHNRMEARSLGFHQAVREAFLSFAAAEPERYRVIDAAQPIDAVVEAATRAMMQRLAEAVR